jgi:hypothetical protein
MGGGKNQRNGYRRVNMMEYYPLTCENRKLRPVETILRKEAWDKGE